MLQAKYLRVSQRQAIPNIFKRPDWKTNKELIPNFGFTDDWVYVHFHVKNISPARIWIFYYNFP
ncbi:MAG: hypothetical protein AAF518_18430, partial [Spirochaetota bacterium]